MIKEATVPFLALWLEIGFFLLIGAVRSCMLQLNISLIWFFFFFFCKKGYSSHCRVSIKLSGFFFSPPLWPKRIKIFLYREHIYHSSIVNYRVWYLCASGKPRDVTGYRISGLGFKERRKPLEK
uniref:Uncharacterized protein n=1 Tax=Panthera leo TaxID=9689 RepID=A0A8C8WLU0_PANLE